jgi:hypothetical protein
MSGTAPPVVTPEQFVNDFPEFADQDAYSKSAITSWLTVGQALMNAARWGVILPMAIELFCAHNLVLERQAQISAKGGHVPGINVGALQAKGLGKASISYDTTAGTIKDAASFNLSTYGTRLMKFMEWFGMGPIQVTNDWQGPICGLWNVGAWPGPIIGGMFPGI